MPDGNQFIVIEGLDGSGKSTQIGLIQEGCRQRNIPFEYLHFPRTETGYYGALIARFLRGELGPLDSVHPYLVAMIYAGNRYDAREQIRQWMDDGITVVADRYVLSNIAFQCAKISDTAARKELRDWIMEFEYQYHCIPRPDISIYLDVPFAFTRQQLSMERDGADREYLEGKQDIHEKDLSFQAKVRSVYQSLAEELPDLQTIDCGNEQDSMRSPEEIFSEISELIFVSH